MAKTLDEIKTELYNLFAYFLSKEVGYPISAKLHEGDIIKVILDTLALQIFNYQLAIENQAFYLDFKNLRDTELNLKAEEFGLTRKDGEYAAGYLSFSPLSPGQGTIPVGTRITDGIRSYSVVNSVNWSGSATFSVLVKADTKGPDHNLLPFQFRTQANIAGTVFNIENKTSIMGGEAEETDDHLKERIRNILAAQHTIGTYSWLINKVLNLTDGVYTICNVNLYEDPLTYSNYLYCDLGLPDNKAPLLSGGTIRIRCGDLITAKISTGIAPWDAATSVQVIFLKDYTDISGSLLIPYQNNPIEPWDYAFNYATGEVLFNLNKIQPSAGNGILVSGNWLTGVYQTAQQKVNEDRLIGLNVLVAPAAVAPITLKVSLTAKQNISLKIYENSIRNSITNFIEQLTVGEDFTAQRLVHQLFLDFGDLLYNVIIYPELRIVNPNEKLRLENLILTLV